ncbi:MAG TPA: serine--tRNA ligase [Verrucomicrobiae bacterium]|nr:serine--tRNA ligase [Verrucomicrobiae bacterium]
MLDIKRIRENAAAVKARLGLRGPAATAAADELLAADARWRTAIQSYEALQAEKNRISREIGAKKKAGESAADLMARSVQLSSELDATKGDADARELAVRDLALRTPNLPHESVPPGASADDNPEVGRWGQAPAFTSPPRDHVALGTALGILDFDAAAKVSGSGFVVYRGAGARLERALINFLLDLHTREHGYTEISPPFIILRDAMVGTGQLPKFEEDMYRVPDEGGDLFLAPTAEVPVTNLHREEILKEADLPKRYAAYTPCFRREAGSYGKDTRGMIRMHQFDKVELVKIVHPDHSYDELESLRRNAETVLERLDLHYRTVLLCAGDMGFGAAKCYDIEVWAPGQNRFLEVSSCSNFEDFQARRMNLRFKGTDGKNRFCHTLNGSGTALARLVVALLETGQQPDGSVRLPQVLGPYLQGELVIRN